MLDGRAVQKRILGEVAAEVAKCKSEGRPVGGLVSISIGATPEVDIYIRNQARAAAACGIEFEKRAWPESITQAECKAALAEMNDDAGVVGVILQRPVPDHINLRSLQGAIHPLKDVEGMNPASIGNIIYNDVALAPCTAAAALQLIRETGLKMEGLEVVMIGHSEIVGKPVAMMLMAEGATVTVCHHLTRSVASHSRRADVVIIAVGKPNLIGPDLVRPGAAVIDIGINQVSGDQGETRIVGDVDTDAVKEVASWITPVPGGVGPVTTAILMRNALCAHSRQMEAGWI